MMAGTLDGTKVAFLTATEGVEQVELTQPWAAVEAAGGTPVLISTKVGTVQGFDHLTAADTFEATLAAGEATATDYAGLVLPGGVANPDALRTDAHAVALIKAFVDAGLPVAAICHAPWTLIEADVVAGRTLTSWPSLRTDIGNAGGNWVDEQVVVDELRGSTLVTSRNPDDLDAFCAAVVERFGA